MTGISMRGGALARMIQEFPSVKLVVIDSLTGVSGGVELCKGSDAMILAKLKTSCLRPDLTIIFTHHITEKKELPVDILMMCDPHALTMYSSVINQQMDGYYIAGSPDTDGVLKKLCIRPISKRVAIKMKSFETDLVETEETLNFAGWREYDIKAAGLLREIELDIAYLFKNKPGAKLTVREIDVAMGGMHGINTLREALLLMRKKELIKIEKDTHNLFKFSLKNGKNKNLEELDEATLLMTEDKDE